MSNVVIKTAESEIKNDKNGRKYKTVSFGEVKYIDTPFGKMLVPSTQARTTKANCYELNYLGKQDSGYVDALFNAANPKHPNKGPVAVPKEPFADPLPFIGIEAVYAAYA